MYCFLLAHSVTFAISPAEKVSDTLPTRALLHAAMPPKAAITITMQEGALVATTLAGNEVLRTAEVDMPGREMKQALKQALGHASFVMVTPGAEKLTAGAKGIAEQFNALASRMHPRWHRVDDSELRRICLPCMRPPSERGFPVSYEGRGGHLVVDMNGNTTITGLAGCRMEKIPYKVGEEFQSAWKASIDFTRSQRRLAQLGVSASRERSRSRSRVRAELATAAQRVRDWRPSPP